MKIKVNYNDGLMAKGRISKNVNCGFFKRQKVFAVGLRGGGLMLFYSLELIRGLHSFENESQAICLSATDNHTCSIKETD